MSNDQTRLHDDIEIGEAIWTDRDGIGHWAVGRQTVAGQPNTLELRTACGEFEIPTHHHILLNFRPGHVANCEKCVLCLDAEDEPA